MKQFSDYSLLGHNTFGIDARCKRFVEVATADELKAFAASRLAAADRLLVVGAGSNLLLTRDFDGTVLHPAIMGMERLRGCEGCDEDHVLLRVGCGETWDQVVAHCVAQGWYGAENLSLIPGEVGASAVQNIGAYGVEAKDIIYKVEVVELATGRLLALSAGDCGYGYRQSRFKQEWRGRYVVSHVTYRLATHFTPQLDYGNIRAELQRQAIEEPTAQELRQTIIDIRRQKLPDPEELGNAGSFFMNPVVQADKLAQLLATHPHMPHYLLDNGQAKIPAAWLIDQCGWKGRSLGPAGVHSRQPLVLVNLGGATGSDVVRLCQAVVADVEQHFGISLHPEVNIV